MGGHLFIINGDLTKIACDAILIPTDYRFNITTHWQDFLDEYHADQLREFQSHAAESWGSEHVVQLGHVDNMPEVWLGNIGRVGDHSDFETFKPALAEFVAKATEACKANTSPRDCEWPKPRLAVNVVGSDQGGGSQKKGDLVLGLVETLSDLATSALDVDIILVTFGAKPYAAAQRARHIHFGGNDDETLSANWKFEDEPSTGGLVQYARRLADEAIYNQLVLFIGAGVGSGAGLPMWGDLLSEVATNANIEGDSFVRLTSKDLRDQATILERRLELQETNLKQAVADRLKAPCYSLVHGLLASLPSKEAVTTNYDKLFETAWRTGGRELAILPAEAVETSRRWLLKLHGTVDKPHEIVLTRSDYLDMPRRSGALMGLVQGLLMMRHMMFVGYSMQDEDFHELIHEVRTARGDRPDRELRATVLTLREDQLDRELWIKDLHIVPMSADREPKMRDDVAARQLEMFLDLVGYLSTTSAAFFLDDTYNALSEDEQELREDLAKLVAKTKDAERDQVAYKVLRFLRDELGADVTTKDTTRSGQAPAGRAARSSVNT